jgi:hypothetical protein
MSNVVFAMRTESHGDSLSGEVDLYTTTELTLKGRKATARRRLLPEGARLDEPRYELHLLNSMNLLYKKGF